MTRALALARRARGASSPNPPVGAVLLKAGCIVGEGYTQTAGQAHAEIVALCQAGPSAQGADLFVTLEPCAHWGRTPPCVDALISAGLQSARVAILDPNPLTCGRGVTLLGAAGIEVTVDPPTWEATELIEEHTRFTTTGLPFVTLAQGLPREVAVELVRPDRVIDDEMRVGEPDPASALAAMSQGGQIALLILADHPAASALLAAGLVNKIVADSRERLPAGFRMKRQSENTATSIAYPCS